MDITHINESSLESSIICKSVEFLRTKNLRTIDLEDSDQGPTSSIYKIPNRILSRGS